MKERKFSGKRIFYESIDSTNEEMQRILQKTNFDEGTVVYAGFQTGGKGHMGNRWESEPGKNILMSILFLPDFLEPQHQFYLSMVVSLSLLEIIGSYCPQTKIKWPNDLFVKDKKIAGLLVENQIRGNIIEKTVAGIGLNVNQEKFSMFIPAATSLYMEKKCHFDMTKLLERLMGQMEVWYNLLAGSERELIRRNYTENLYGLEEMLTYSHDGKIFNAMIIDVEPSGELVLETEKGDTLKFGFREVMLIR